MNEQAKNQTFESEPSLEIAFNKLYKQLRNQIHPDRFPVSVYGSKINHEAQEFMMRLTEIFNGKVGNGKGVKEISSWREKMDELELLQGEIESFIQENKQKNNETKKSVNGADEKQDENTSGESFDDSGEKVSEGDSENAQGKNRADVDFEEEKAENQEDSKKGENEERRGEKRYKTEQEYKDFLKKRGDLTRKHSDDFGVDMWFKKYYAGTDMVGVRISGYDDERGTFAWTITREKFEELIELMKLPEGQRGSLEKLLGLRKKPKKNSEKGEEEKKPKKDKKESKKEEKEEELKDKDEDESEKNKSSERSRTKKEKEASGAKEGEKNDSFDLISGTELEKLEELEEAVRLARRDYTVHDLKVNSIYAKISRVLGRVFNKESKTNPDTKVYYERYIKALSDLKEYQLEALRKKYADLDTLPEGAKLAKNEELKKDFDELVSYFNYDEKLNLFDARTNALAEAKKDKFGEKILRKGADIVKWYRELNWKKKLAFSVFLLAGGTGASLLATAGISSAAGIGAFIGGLKLTQRGLSGLATGAGVVGMQETLSRSRDKRKASKKKAKNLEAVLGEKSKAKSLKAKLNEINSVLDKELEGYEKAFKRERRKIVSRHLVGIGAGALVGSGAAAWMMRAGFAEAGEFLPGKDELIEKGIAMKDSLVAGAKDIVNDSIEKISAEAKRTGVKGFAEKVSGFFMNGEVGGDVPPDLDGGVSMPENPNPEMVYAVSDEKSMGGSGSGVAQGFSTSEKIANQIIENKHEIVETKVATGLVDIEIKKGDSIERVIIRRLTDPNGVNLPKAEAGRVAHLMALEYAKEHGIPYDKLHLIHPGDHLKLNLDSRKILDLERLSEIHKGVGTSVVLDNASVGSMPENPNPEMADAISDEKSMGGSGSGVISESGVFSTSEMANISEMPDYAQKYGEKFVKLKQLKINMEKGIEVIDGNELPKVFGKAYQSLCSSLTQDLFEKNGVLEYEPYQLKSIDAEFFLQNEDNEKITNLSKYVARKFGEGEVKPRVYPSGYKENILEWSQRMIGKMIEASGIKL